MSERLKAIFIDFERTYRNLIEATNNAKTDLEIDGAIKRFELCYELAWKIIKEYLANLGIICKNPRDCFKYAYQNGLINDENVWLEMIGVRNQLVHTYTSEQSREVFEKMRSKYIEAFENLALLDFVWINS